MKIIQRGNIEDMLKPKLFQCDQCGCRFEADKTEYKGATQIAYMHDGITAECECPTCHAKAYSYEWS